MSDQTDVLGKALCANLNNVRRPEELEEAVSGLQAVIGAPLTASIMQTGLLVRRTEISLENWDSILSGMKKAVPPPPAPKNESKESMDADEELNSIPKAAPKVSLTPFNEDYMPTELIIDMFHFLDSRSHGSFETCNKRLSVISRNPSSNLSLGCHFEGASYEVDSAICPSFQFCLGINSDEPLCRSMAKGHRYKRLKKLTLFPDANDTVIDDPDVDFKRFHIGTYVLLKSCEQRVEELVLDCMYDSDIPSTPWPSICSPDLIPPPHLKRLR